MGQKPTKVSTGLLELPLDLLFDIAGLLPVESQVALRMASKDLNRVLDPRPLQALRHDRQLKGQFLRIMERDLPDMLHCACCNVLYKWRRHSSRSRSHMSVYPKLHGRDYSCRTCRRHFLNDCNREDYHRHYTNGSCCCAGIFDGLGCEKDLVLLRHSNGPESKLGLPISVLNHECTERVDTKGWKIISRDTPHPGDYEVSRKYRGKIVGDQILMFSEFHFDLDATANALEEVEKIGRFLCPCACSNASAVALCAWLHGEENHESSVNGRNGRRCQQTMKCFTCDTDFQVSIKKMGGRARLSLQMWQNLGGRSSWMPEQARRQFWGTDRYASDEAYTARTEAVMTRDLAKTFETESWVLPSLAGAQITDELCSCVVQNWRSTIFGEFWAITRLPDFGALPSTLIHRGLAASTGIELIAGSTTRPAKPEVSIFEMAALFAAQSLAAGYPMDCSSVGSTSSASSSTAGSNPNTGHRANLHALRAQRRDQLGARHERRSKALRERSGEDKDTI